MQVPFVEGGLGGSHCFGQGECRIGRGGVDDGETGSEGAVIEPCTEQCGAQALGCDAVSVGTRDTLDKTVHAQATQIVGAASPPSPITAESPSPKIATALRSRAPWAR